MCFPYVYSNVELFRGKHQKMQHCNIFLLLLISNYFYFKNSEKVGTRGYLMYWGRDICGILSLWVIFEVLIAVSVRRAVVLVVTPCTLIEIYHHFFLYYKVRCGRFLHLYGGNRASFFLQNICISLPVKTVVACRLMVRWKMKFLNNWGTLTDVQQYVPCSPLIDECDSVVPLDVHPFHPGGKPE